MAVVNTIFYTLPSSETIARWCQETPPTFRICPKVSRSISHEARLRIGPTEEQQVLQARERKPNLPLQVATTTDFTFLRYIGHPRMEVNDSLLDGWAQQIGQWLKQGTAVYVFCHCPFEKHSPEICAALYQRVSALMPLSPLIWQQEAKDTEIQQSRLF